MNQPMLSTLLLLAVAACATGCNPPASTSSTDGREPARQPYSEVKTETAEAAREVKDYTFAQRNEFTEAMKSDLAGINRDLDQIAARLETASDSAKAEAQPKLQALREKAAKFNTQLAEVGNATESTWNDVKSGFKQGYEELKDGINQARQWVSAKIAP